AFAVSLAIVRVLRGPTPRHAPSCFTTPVETSSPPVIDRCALPETTAARQTSLYQRPFSSSQFAIRCVGSRYCRRIWGRQRGNSTPGDVRVKIRAIRYDKPLTSNEQ